MNHNEPFRPPFQLKSRYLARELSPFVGATEIPYESDEFTFARSSAPREHCDQRLERSSHDVELVVRPKPHGSLTPNVRVDATEDNYGSIELVRMTSLLIPLASNGLFGAAVDGYGPVGLNS